MRVLILGSSGMLGRAVSHAFQDFEGEVTTLSRDQGFVIDQSLLASDSALAGRKVQEFDWILNCLGVTKFHIDSSSATSIKHAVLTNSVFPNWLAEQAEQTDSRVVQVATDCVFRGSNGPYNENSAHDPVDVYGKTKSLGEAKSEKVMHLRCSLIGPEAHGRSTLFYEWVRKLSPKSQVHGYTNHMWNGLTSHAFAKVARGIVQTESFRAGVQHLVPSGSVSKLELVELLLEQFGRKDVVVVPHEPDIGVDRTLSTIDAEFNQRLFQIAGYSEPPSIASMLDEQTSHQE